MKSDVISKNFLQLVDIIKKLRDPLKGCPWDKEQTHESLKQYLIEESYEVCDAIDLAEERPKLKEELGDVLLQVLLHAQIAAEANNFTIDDVVTTLSDKLIRRHPHVFGDVTVKDSKGVVENWNKIKQTENKDASKRSIVDGVPRHLPALFKAQKIGEKVVKVGFDWHSTDELKQKVIEEIQEFLAASNESSEKVKEEFGDLLFCMAQLARFLGFQAEEALQAGNAKFIRRFKRMEQINPDISKLSRDEMDKLWNEVKKQEG